MSTLPFMCFQKDELLSKVNNQWSVHSLLAQPALFFLKDVCARLEISSLSVADHARSLIEQGQDAYAVMGVRKVWNHWYVRMKVFAPYYLAHLKTDIRQVQRGWDANTLLAQKGLFLLSQVCKCIPFSSGQLRHQARKLTVEQCGIYKNGVTYLIKMEVFGPWLSRLWQEGFQNPQARSAKPRKKAVKQPSSQKPTGKNIKKALRARKAKN